MKNLGREEDVRSTSKAMADAPSWYLSIPERKTPWYLISLDYADGYVHWYDAGAGHRRVVCAGGIEGRGFAPDACPICAYTLELYQEAKRLEASGDSGRAKQVRERAGRIRAKAETHFKALRGERVLVKTKTGKVEAADFEVSEDDDESAVAAGIISLSKAQWEGLIGMRGDSSVPQIKTAEDFGNRVLWTSKESRKGSRGGKYSAVVWHADPQESDMPDFEIPEELLEMDLGDDFETNPEELEKVYALLSGQELEEPEDDEEVAMETDSAEDADDADLDDIEDDSDDEDGKDFKDDVPWDEDEEEEEPAPKKKSPPKKASTSRKSGKARM